MSGLEIEHIAAAYLKAMDDALGGTCALTLVVRSTTAGVTTFGNDDDLDGLIEDLEHRRVNAVVMQDGRH